jgi:hypothetical protein
MPEYRYSRMAPDKNRISMEELGNPVGHRMGITKRYNRLVTPRVYEYTPWCTCKWKDSVEGQVAGVNWYPSRKFYRLAYERHIQQAAKQGSQLSLPLEVT